MGKLGLFGGKVELFGGEASPALPPLDETLPGDTTEAHAYIDVVPLVNESS